jgi:hypothetical protein
VLDEVTFWGHQSTCRSRTASTGSHKGLFRTVGVAVREAVQPSAPGWRTCKASASDPWPSQRAADTLLFLAIVEKLDQVLANDDTAVPTSITECSPVWTCELTAKGRSDELLNEGQPPYLYDVEDTHSCSCFWSLRWSTLTYGSAGVAGGVAWPGRPALQQAYRLQRVHRYKHTALETPPSGPAEAPPSSWALFIR